MRKRLAFYFVVLSPLLFVGFFSASAQIHPNRWINYSQKYYKITVAQNGIYRIDSAQLAHAGLPVAWVNPKTIQLFFRGEEQPIYIKGEADGVFNAKDYIEFYGQKNDGTVDSTLYKGIFFNQPAKQPNPYYSLFNDTSAYFFTWSNSPSTKRIIEVSDTNYATYNSTPYFFKKEVIENHSTYYYGYAGAANIIFPEYHETESWASLPFQQGGNYTATFTTNHVFSAGPAAKLSVAVIGASNDNSVNPDHLLQIQYKNAGNNFIALGSTSFDGYQLYRANYSIPSADIGANLSIVVNALGGSFSTSRNAVPYLTFHYPHSLDLEAKNYFEFFVPPSVNQSKSNFSFSNFSDWAAPVFVYDFIRQQKIAVTKNGNVFNALVENPSTGGEKFCVIKSDKQFLTPASIRPVRGNATFTHFAALKKDSAYIIITHKNLWSGANDYSNYRASAAGGKHATVVVDVEELYDQFSYGIAKHPLAIRNFSRFCLDSFPTPPQHIFLIGKSVQNNLYRNTIADPSGTNYKNCLVPSLAYPTCDNMLVAALKEKSLKPAISLGRLAANTNNDVLTYLNKVKEYESLSLKPQEWMKKIIHLGGGSNAAEQQLLNSFLKGYETLLEGKNFGGQVYTFSKNSSSPTQTSFSDSIKELINNGVGIINFFGHTSATVFDFNLLPPGAYSNANGKYPFFNVDGCVSGDIHQPLLGGISSSEVYTLSPKGVIGFLASSGLGTAFEMDRFASEFYKNASQKMYGKPVGECIRAAIDSAEGDNLNDYMNATCLEMTLHGDPAIVLHAQAKPDYSVDNASVYFSPSYISTELDSFKVHVMVTNIGRASDDTVSVSLKRIFSDGTHKAYQKKFPRIYFKDTLTFKLPVDAVQGSGINKFEVRVDELDKVDEIDNFVNNNILSPFEIPLLIYSGDVIPVYPPKYAIIPADSVTLKAYTANPFAAAGTYLFEIDTTDRFNSPQKGMQKIHQTGGVVKARFKQWLPAFTFADSTVYFWRVRRDTADTTHFKWRESSFQYIPKKRGAGQSHFNQFTKGNAYHYITPHLLKRYFDFERTNYSIEVQARNYTAMGGGAFFSQTWLYVNGLQESLSSYLSTANAGNVPAHVLVHVIDPVTGNVWKNNGNGPFGSYPCPPVKRFEFPTGSPLQQEKLRSFLKDSLACGSKVMILAADNHNLGSILNASSPLVNAGLVQAFQSVGGIQFSSIQNNFPYILIGRKCGVAIEKIGSSDTSIVFLKDTIGIKRKDGYILSETMGPASKWNSFHCKYKGAELHDSIRLSIIGIKNNGSADTLLKNTSTQQLDIYNLDNTIHAATYPFVRLQAWVQDSLRRTPLQLQYWRIYYDGVPDASLNPSLEYSFHKHSVQQGDSIKMKTAIENIGDYDMDSLWVDCWVYDVNRNKIPIQSIKMDSLRVGKALFPEVKFSSENIPAGLNSLWIEANPFNAQHQTEPYHLNNVGAIPFTVNADVINPILDVTFDGVKIMNGDIVSSKPVILITLKDENTFLALNDTADFELFLKMPNQSSFQKINFGSTLLFTPAQLPANSCKIHYSPTLPDGVYQLKVQAKDRSGNLSGKSVYAISFEVVNKPTLTHVVNYPNPFSTATRFVFTLTGNRVPDYFKIQILTISGKIVKEIDKHDLGSLHIGKNITDYAWDGKDEYGDRLANGIYLYRVITQLDGKALEHRSTAADAYFNQGYGKMYLIK